MTTAIHRVIEQHAASRGQHLALVDGQHTITYRELNQAANTVARRLIGHGFRRGGHAWIHLPRGADLACVLLGVLKAGGSYTWIDPDRTDSSFPLGVSLSLGGQDDQYLHIDTGSLVREIWNASSPNLPVVCRGADIACILRDDAGAPVVLVPHEALTTLPYTDVEQPAAWAGEPGALDLWLALLQGGTALVEERAAEVAAA